MDDVRGRVGVLWWAFVVVSALGGFLWYFAVGTFGVVGTVVLILSALSLLIGTVGGIDHARRSSTKGQIARTSTGHESVESASPTAITAVEMTQLADQFTKTSKAIYAFLDKHAERSDEAKVVAEYRRKFDAKVYNLCLDLISAGLADTKGLRHTMTPPTTVEDIQWIARGMALTGHGYSAERFENYRALAMGELTKKDLPHKSSCPARPRVERFMTEKPDGTEVETTRCLECGAAIYRLEIPADVLPFLRDWTSDPGTPPLAPLAALEHWMDRESIPQSQRQRLRERTEAYLTAVQEDATTP